MSAKTFYVALAAAATLALSRPAFAQQAPSQATSPATTAGPKNVGIGAGSTKPSVGSKPSVGTDPGRDTSGSNHENTWSSSGNISNSNNPTSQASNPPADTTASFSENPYVGDLKLYLGDGGLLGPDPDHLHEAKDDPRFAPSITKAEAYARIAAEQVFNQFITNHHIDPQKVTAEDKTNFQNRAVVDYRIGYQLAFTDACVAAQNRAEFTTKLEEAAHKMLFRNLDLVVGGSYNQFGQALSGKTYSLGAKDIQPVLQGSCSAGN